MNTRHLILLGTAFAAVSLSAQNALDFGGTGLVSSNQNLRDYDATNYAVPFSAHVPRSPSVSYSGAPAVASYTGGTFYGGAFITTGSGAQVDQWQITNDDTSGDYLQLRMGNAPANGEVFGVFLWSRDEFNAPFRDGSVVLASSNGLVFNGRRFGGSIDSDIRFIIQNGAGDYFISDLHGAIPSSDNTVALNSATTWYAYTPATNTVGSPVSPSPAGNPIFAAGVRLRLKKTSAGTAITAALRGFEINANAIASTDDNIETVMDLVGRAVSQSRVNLAWTPEAGAVKYVVSRGTTAGVYTVTYESAAPAFQDFRLSPATSYYYKVAWVDSGGTSYNSSEIRVVTDVDEGVIARHPSVHFTAEEVDELKARITTVPWSSWYGDIKAKAENHVGTNDKDPSNFAPGTSGFIECASRGEVVTALALVWQLDTDQTLRDACLAELKTYLASIPAPPSAGSELPSISDIGKLITPKKDAGEFDPAIPYDDYPSPGDANPQYQYQYYYASALSISYPSRGYALAYDIVFNELAPAERAATASRIKRHAEVLHDATFAWDDPSTAATTTSNQSINSKANNWVDVMAGGLAVAGAALRDYVESSQNWGNAYLESALLNLENVVDSDRHTKGGGAYIEGEVYSAFAGYWASEALHAIRAVDFDTSPAIGELFATVRYQDWLGFRTRNLMLAGRPTLFEAARNYQIDSQKWVAAYLREHTSAAMQARLEWLRKIHLDNPTTATEDYDMSSALFRYYSADGLATPIPAESYVDAAAGLAFFRSGNPGAGTSDDANSLALAHSNKPYPGTITGTTLNSSAVTRLTHFYSTAASLELWAYGAYVANEPGYNTGNFTDSEGDHIPWAREQAKAHNNLRVGLLSPHNYVASEGFSSWSTGHALEFVSGLVLKPFTARTYNASGGLLVPNPATIPDPTDGNPDHSVMRTVLFVRPTATAKGYFVVFDNVQTAGGSDTVDWYLHGMTDSAGADNLTTSGKSATWTGIVPAAGGTTVNFVARQAVPHVSGTLFTKNSEAFKEHYAGRTGYNSDYVSNSKTGSQQFLTVLHPYLSTDTAPSFSNVMFSSVVRGTTINAASQFAVTQPTNDMLTYDNYAVSDGLNFFARRASPNVLACYFAEESSTLHSHPTPNSGFATSDNTRITIVMDQYDAMSNRLRGSISYIDAGGTFSLTLNDPALPASGGTLTLVDRDGTPYTGATLTQSSGQVVIGNLPANDVSNPVWQLDLVVQY
ncbi:MAG: hypothetical protein ACOZE5_16895 [Verrucomicrobiota bacterium]